MAVSHLDHLQACIRLFSLTFIHFKQLALTTFAGRHLLISWYNTKCSIGSRLGGSCSRTLWLVDPRGCRSNHEPSDPWNDHSMASLRNWINSLWKLQLHNFVAGSIEWNKCWQMQFQLVWWSVTSSQSGPPPPPLCGRCSIITSECMAPYYQVGGYRETQFNNNKNNSLLIPVFAW